MPNQAKLSEALTAFFPEDTVRTARRHGSGHIHATYWVETEEGEYILQKINRQVFPKIREMMANIAAVTSYLERTLASLGRDPVRETLHILPDRAGECFYQDSAGECWRAYHFIRDAAVFQKADTPELFGRAAQGFGRFLELLEGFPVNSLYEILPDFHNTPVRFSQLQKAIAENRAGRFKGAAREIEFVLRRQGTLSLLTDALQKGELPLRVTHNDTKLNNLLFDKKTGEPLCVVDLDTVMPGLSLYDFGDAVRFGASTAAEDEPDLNKVHFSLPHFEAYVEGYRSSAGEKLTALEYELMPEGARLMTLECGMRFLADYLNGDIYFHTEHPAHNLERARTQFVLVEDMERQWDRMKQTAANGKGKSK